MKRTECSHPNLEVQYELIDPEISDERRRLLRLWVICPDCQTECRFLGLPCGADADHPGVTVDRCEVRLPVQIPLDPSQTTFEDVRGWQGYRPRGKRGAPIPAYTRRGHAK